MIRLSIPDMSCGHCVNAVTQAVRKADPNAKVSIDLGGRTAEIETCTPLETLAAAIEQAVTPTAHCWTSNHENASTAIGGPAVGHRRGSLR